MPQLWIIVEYVNTIIYNCIIRLVMSNLSYLCLLWWQTYYNALSSVCSFNQFPLELLKVSEYLGYFLLEAQEVRFLTATDKWALLNKPSSNKA